MFRGFGVGNGCSRKGITTYPMSLILTFYKMTFFCKTLQSQFQWEDIMPGHLHETEHAHTCHAVEGKKKVA
jgi:hypothetical protein